MCQQNSKATVPLDVVPERLTERCAPRFRPGGRFWSQVSDTCRQVLRWCTFNDCGCALTETLLFMVHSHLSLVFFHMVRAGAYWHKQNCPLPSFDFFCGGPSEDIYEILSI